MKHFKIEELIRCYRETGRCPECPLHNAAVGGVANSQHMRGEAADVCCADNKRLSEIIEANGKYDQLIRYMNKNGGIRFIHVSWKRLGVNRKMKFNK